MSDAGGKLPLPIIAARGGVRKVIVSTMRHISPRTNSSSALLASSRIVPSQLRSASPVENRTRSSPRSPMKSPKLTTHCFYLFKNRTAKFAVVTFALSSTLTELTIERVSAPVSAKTFSVCDMSIIADFSPELRRALIESGLNSRLYGFRLLTHSKSYEIGSDSLESRDKWVQILSLLHGGACDLRKSDAVKRYLQLQCKAEEIDQQATTSGLTKRSLISTVKSRENDWITVNREIVALVLSDIVTQLEFQEEKEKINQLNEDLMSLVTHYQSEIMELETDLKSHRKERNARSRLWKLQKQRSRPLVWRAALSFLTVGEVVKIQGTAKELQRVSHSLLRSREYWKTLSDRGFNPRTHSWMAYCRLFTQDPGLAQDTAISSDEKKQIQGDVERCDFSLSVASVLTQLCSKYPDVGYCQGMHLTTEFILTVVRDDASALFLLSRLMNSPYHLSEVWKPGLPRVKLVAFQLESLLRLKLPRLSLHFEQLDLPLEVLVAPWVLTLFTQLVPSMQNFMPRCVLLRIWDLFLVKGWPAVHAVSLGILQMCEGER